MKAFNTQHVLSNRIGRLACTAALLTSLTGAAVAQEQQQVKHPAKARQYYDLYQPTGSLAASREDRATFDRSGTRGREGLGENPMHPEGPGNFSN